MAATNWKGGKTGLEDMPAGYTSVYYSEIIGEVPRLYNLQPLPPYGYGSFQGPSSIQHSTIYPYLAGSLVATVGGSAAPVTEVNPGQGLFKLPTELTGYVRVVYSPYSEELYYNKTAPADMPYAPIRYRLIPSKREHINELIVAINAISDRIGTIRRRYSLKAYTGEAESYNTDTGIDRYAPVLKQLMQETGEHVIYLYNYSLVKYGAAIVPDTQFTYESNNISATTIEDIRQDINTLENALDTVGA